jgi:hypothetical protein
MNIQTLLEIWTELSATYPEYINTFKARHQGIIYHCDNGKIVSQEPGTSLHKQDRNDDRPDKESYLESGLEPDDEQERKIIDDYNALVKKKYLLAVERSDREYQLYTLMMQYNYCKDDVYKQLDIERYLTRQFKKYGVDASAEKVRDKCISIVWEGGDPQTPL